MEFHFARPLSQRAREAVALALVCLPLLGVAQVAVNAPAPSLAGPSLVQSTKGAVFAGRGFKPNTAVSIALQTPHGVESHLSAMVSADGKVSYHLPVGMPGQHKLSVLDSSGKPLASTNFIVVQ
jgi:hypothetical protein